MDSLYGTGSSFRWVSPFRHLRVDGYLLLTAAFRSLSRLSSALSAKASTLRPYKLDLSSPRISVSAVHGLIDFLVLKLNSHFLLLVKVKLKIGLLLSLGLLDIDVNMQFSRYILF